MILRCAKLNLRYEWTIQHREVMCRVMHFQFGMRMYYVATIRYGLNPHCVRSPRIVGDPVMSCCGLMRRASWRMYGPHFVMSLR